MAEQLCDDLWVNAAFEEQRRASMPEILEADSRHAHRRSILLQLLVRTRDRSLEGADGKVRWVDDCARARWEVRNAISILKTSGYVELSGDNVTITAAGRATAPAGTVDQRSIVDTWRAKFGGATLRMLDILLDRPQGMSRAELAACADVDVSTSTFRNSLSLLRSAGAIVVDRNHVRPDESLAV